MASDAAVGRVVTWPNYSKENVAQASKKDGQTLGKDEFLKILITQLQNQDPMQPMQDRDFIAQMAQFSSVEQLMNIQTQLGSLHQALGMSSSLIGKEITWYSTSEDKEYQVTGQEDTNPVLRTGIVESMIIRDGVSYAKVGKNEVELSTIAEIREPGETPDTEEPEQPGQPEEPEQPGPPEEESPGGEAEGQS
ncbi:flagellar hook capping protein [Paenibacillus thiaminolyticus]|uniref:Flagellar hook capping protein n=1 Tax=Paenibacillus thiaminolyticus TaxID=49283 RepID=A0AAP9DZG7_PANTH|nr:flagellar hook capping FlgD N-terminal domain-containing protein [Paenibacillus thiaminolyticus]MCY9538621.1 flagellar hook capping protein [Paenibacillus thiaminolyticus]MCY9603264.1 flagellar hook capping protein [Paenibacillus thiaminolyticus]MCY9609767.1 flagellar hook capping protein [Paenibacillus thiaminolyticus]MCY9613711.1 flagellar hook capping protein [Paenibacillus thiaminolyticus]MCY9618873.1 flagellar hook capping protein [Paenibacillus thiaminolyticus]